MIRLIPHVRDCGAGPAVVCLHANASSSSQWRALTERLAPDHHVYAADALGAGKSPAWPADRVVTLGDEVALLAPVFASAGDRCALVGHSYGAAIALIAALARPGRVRALAVYEPTLFSLVDAQPTGRDAVDGIRSAAGDAASAIEAGDTDRAAERFIDYWMGAGSWRAMPPERQAPIAASMVNVAGWARALFTEPTPLSAFRTLDLPILYMVGGRSPPASRAVAALLTQALPNVSVTEFAELGHMGPVTHPQPVNEAIAAFLAQHRG